MGSILGKKSFLKIIFIGFFFQGYLAQALDTRVPPIKKGASVEVRSWDPQTRVVELKIVSQPVIGPNFADIDDFIQATNIKGVRAQSVKRNPASIKGVVVSLKKQLKLLGYQELKARWPKQKSRQKINKKK